MSNNTLLKTLLLAAVILLSTNAQCSVCNGTCADAYFYDFSTFVCSPCPSDCANCTDAGTCTQCVSGALLGSDYNCIDCGVNNCTNCSSAGNCTVCQAGYYLVEPSFCQQCANTSYTDPLTDQQSSVGLCSVCNVTGCTQCLSSATIQANAGTDLYLMLMGGAYIDDTNTCQFCSLGCTACTSATSCSACMPGFVFSSANATCNVCPDYCEVCDSTATTCTSCSSGAYLSGSLCYTCSAGCNSCVNNSTCTVCSTGFFLNSNNGCTQCLSDCVACSDAVSCDQCMDGYENQKGKYGVSMTTCSSCPDGCLGCLTTSVLNIGICATGTKIVSSLAIMPLFLSFMMAFFV